MHHHISPRTARRLSRLAIEHHITRLAHAARKARIRAANTPPSNPFASGLWDLEEAGVATQRLEAEIDRLLARLSPAELERMASEADENMPYYENAQSTRSLAWVAMRAAALSS